MLRVMGRLHQFTQLNGVKKGRRSEAVDCLLSNKIAMTVFFLSSLLHSPRYLRPTHGCCCIVFTAVCGSGKHVEQPRVRLTRDCMAAEKSLGCIVCGRTNTRLLRTYLGVYTCNVHVGWRLQRRTTNALQHVTSALLSAIYQAGWSEGPWLWVLLGAVSTVCTTVCSSICEHVYMYILPCTSMYGPRACRAMVQARCHHRT